jgi:hypothetical protein
MNRKLVLVALGLIVPLTALAPAASRVEPDPAVGESYRVPFRMTDTNHFLVRVRIDGKGPFNFLVDTGAPAVYVGTEAAKKAGLKVDPDEFYTEVARIDFEGGARLTDVKARVEDPFQMVGMNALGLPGASIDGILGFSALARFRIELDPTQDRMTWTRLDFEPKDPVIPRGAMKKAQAAPEMKAMGALGPIAKLAAALVGKQPEDEIRPRGSLGIELEEDAGQLKIRGILAGSPAASAALKPGDHLVKLLDKPVATLAAARTALAEVHPGDRIPIVVERDGTKIERVLPAWGGF